MEPKENWKEFIFPMPTFVEEGIKGTVKKEEQPGRKSELFWAYLSAKTAGSKSRHGTVGAGGGQLAHFLDAAVSGHENAGSRG